MAETKSSYTSALFANFFTNHKIFLLPLKRDLKKEENL